MMDKSGIYSLNYTNLCPNLSCRGLLKGDGDRWLPYEDPTIESDDTTTLFRDQITPKRSDIVYKGKNWGRPTNARFVAAVQKGQIPPLSAIRRRRAQIKRNKKKAALSTGPSSAGPSSAGPSAKEKTRRTATSKVSAKQATGGKVPKKDLKRKAARKVPRKVSSGSTKPKKRRFKSGSKLTSLIILIIVLIFNSRSPQRD